MTGLGVVGTRLTASVSYAIGRRRWVQQVEATLLDDQAIGVMAAGVGLVVDRWLDEYRTWARLVEPGAPPERWRPSSATGPTSSGSGVA